MEWKKGGLFCLMMLFGTMHGQAAEPLRFAPLPLENRETVIRQFSPLLTDLEKTQRRPVRFVFFDDYEDLLVAFSRNQVDLAYLGPLPYARLRQRHPQAEPIVRFREADGGDLYRCVLVAFRDDRIRIADLRQRLIGLTQPLSTCGYLAVNGMLRRHAGFGLEQTHHRYLGSHEAVALASVAGEVAAGGMKEALARKYAGLGLEVLASAGPFPGFALVANRASLGEADVEALRRALLQTPRAAYARWGEPIRHGMVPAADGDYNGIRALDSGRVPMVEKAR